MLDSDTKTRIDSARDILVGKVPDPKSQVEQITIALSYKFMDDMDRQSRNSAARRRSSPATSRSTAGPTCSTSGSAAMNACFSMPIASRR